jgi:tetracycline 7-halogenase / FADH2 O2-dependent halogenase
MRRDFDIAVVGSGFAGSLVAMIARRLGRSVVLLERHRHPRFAIGESTTPLANLVWEELARRYDLPRLRPLAKWGPWQQEYPAIGCGLKRGFTFYHHGRDRTFGGDGQRRDQLLVAASPRDAVADTHWYRQDLDHFLVGEAQSLGVEYLDETVLHSAEVEAAGATLRGHRQGVEVSLRCRLVLDASGPRGFLHRTLGLGETVFAHLPATQALYNHFTGVQRMADVARIRGDSGESPPYPPDDAAVHHVFDGGWIWVLRFNNGLTSAGVAATERLANELRLPEGRAAWHRLLARLPTVGAQFARATEQRPFGHAPRLAFCSGTATGESWALLPSAAGFVDPLLSTGIPLTLLGIERLANLLERGWGREELGGQLADYGRQTVAELRAAAGLVAALYASLGDFEVFAALALLYFAALSFSEVARRLGRAVLAPGFLLCDQPVFGAALRRCCGDALRLRAGVPGDAAARARLLRQIGAAIAPFDLIGLGDTRRRNWHPVDARDLVNAAAKLGLSREAVEIFVSADAEYWQGGG